MGDITEDRPAQSWASLTRGLARAAGGALIFALPSFMTMEMWWLGFSMDRWRLVAVLVVHLPLLVFISHYSGFERTFEVREDLRDAAIAFGIGLVTSAVVLGLFGVFDEGITLSDAVGKVALQAVPASLGALLARSQLGGRRAEQSREGGPEETYAGELGVMAAGALFLGLNVAPTEEMILISYMMSKWQAVALVLLSLALMHGFVFAAAFKGGSELSEHTPGWSAFLRFTVVGYAIAFLISLFVLWAFGRTDGLALAPVVMASVVLAFPCALGAAAARLII